MKVEIMKVEVRSGTHMDKHRGRVFCALAMLTIALQGCGGGGKDEGATPVSPTPTPTPAPAPAPAQGALKGAERVNTFTAAEVAAALDPTTSKIASVVPRYGVTSYRLTYLTIDGRGNTVTASGLVSVPVKPAGVASPVFSYQHGTTFYNAESPSLNVVASEPPVVMASLGAIVVSADYVGYGASKGVDHPYLLSKATAAAVVDLLSAAKTWRANTGVSDNGQLFLVGYSEGGYATMAAHRALQVGGVSYQGLPLMTVPGAGPYHLQVEMDAMLDRVREKSALLAALLKPGFLSNIGSDLRAEVRRSLLKAVLPDDADITFQSNFIDNYMDDDVGTMERDSNVHNWRPTSPVRMMHGRDDQTVPYATSTVTLQAMNALAAPDVTLTDCPAGKATHLGCVSSYFQFMLKQVAPVVKDL